MRLISFQFFPCYVLHIMFLLHSEGDIIVVAQTLAYKRGPISKSTE
jgi:hypothetical protein